MTNIKITDPKISSQQSYKYFTSIAIIWVSFLILANFTAIKTFNFMGVVLSVGILAYPFTYIFADIFTEVYGYRTTRKVVWTGFASLLVFTLFGYLYAIIPGNSDMATNEAFNLIFRVTPFVALFSALAFFCGELANSIVLAKMKIFHNGKFPELRYITSTIFGQSIDNIIFYSGVFYLAGFYENENLFYLVLAPVLFCIFWETLATPVTRLIIKKIKEVEGIDTYDHGTNFNPFKLG